MSKRKKYSLKMSTFSLCYFLFFIFARVLMHVTFFRFSFCATFFSLGHLEQRQLLSGKWIRDWKKTRNLSEFDVADINKFLSSLFNYKLFYHSNIHFIFRQMIIYLILQFFFFSFILRV